MLRTFLEITVCKIWLLCFSLVGLALPAFCQVKDSLPTSSDSAKRYQLEEVQVRAMDNLRNHAIVPMQVLNVTELSRVNGFSVADAVRYFAGVQLKDYGGVGGLKTINVRSMGTNHTAVFYDGLQLGNAQNGQIDLGKFSLDNMEEVALYNGQKPDLLQPAKAFASASALYLKSKVPHFKEGRVFNLSVGLKTGSFGLTDPAAGLEYQLNKKTSLRISAEGMHAHGRYTFRYTNGVYDTVATRSNGDIGAFRVEGGLYGKPDSSSSWSAKIYHYQSERGLPGAIVANKFDYTQRQWDNNSFVQGSFLRKFNTRYTLLWNGKYSRDNLRYLDPDMVTTTGFLDNHYHQQEVYLSLANQYQLLPFWSLALNADYQHNSLDADLYRFAYPARNTMLVALASQLEFENFQLQASVLSTTVKESVKELVAAEDQQRFTPTLLISYQPIKDQHFYIRAFYKSIFRMPSFNDLYYTFAGSTLLKPEYTRQYDLGMRYNRVSSGGLFMGWDVQLDAYYNRVTDKIIAVPGTNLFRWTMMNLGKTDIKGLEVNLKTYGALGVKMNYSLGLSYTCQEALDASPESYSYRQQIPYAPKHSGSFIASFFYTQWSLSYSFIYTGERYSQSTNIPANYVDPWYTHDISAEYRMALGKHQLSLRAEVNNLLNQYYDVILNFPMPGRSYRFTLSYKL